MHVPSPPSSSLNHYMGFIHVFLRVELCFYIYLVTMFRGYSSPWLLLFECVCVFGLSKNRNDHRCPRWCVSPQVTQTLTTTRPTRCLSPAATPWPRIQLLRADTETPDKPLQWASTRATTKARLLSWISLVPSDQFQHRSTARLTEGSRRLRLWFLWGSHRGWSTSPR